MLPGPLSTNSCAFALHYIRITTMVLPGGVSPCITRPLGTISCGIPWLHKHNHYRCYQEVNPCISATSGHQLQWLLLNYVSVAAGLGLTEVYPHQEHSL